MTAVGYGCLQAKTCFETLSDADFLAARAASNPYEDIGSGGYFVNRSAMKLATLDELLHLLPTSSTSPGEPSPPFTFVDVCGGPGGFTEYILTRLGGRECRGWGVTARALERGCHWQLDGVAGVHDSWPSRQSAHDREHVNDIGRGGEGTRFTLLWGPDGSGNVYNPDVIDAVVSAVKQDDGGTHVAGVDLVVADGGFSGARDRVDQADVMYRLVVCQVLIGLRTLKLGGTLVVKLFDTHTAHMAALLFQLSRLFQRIAIVKPLTSRPASSERYLVCSGLSVHASDVVLSTLSGVNAALGAATTSEHSDFVLPDSSHYIVSPAVVVLHDDFVLWLTRTNNRYVIVRYQWHRHSDLPLV